MIKLAVIGSRSFNNFRLLEKILEPYRPKISTIVSGGAKGADFWGESYAIKYGLEREIYLPDWDKYKKAAGFIRNTQIIENCDAVIAFWDGESHGTQDSITKAEKLGKPIKIIRFDPSS